VGGLYRWQCKRRYTISIASLIAAVKGIFLAVSRLSFPSAPRELSPQHNQTPEKPYTTPLPLQAEVTSPCY
uniref:Uncharacterized protein n=1 Tax=Oryza brachyantha TaxID=4533 RepID=J3LEA1_ORYBR